MNLKLPRLIHWLIYSAGVLLLLCAVVLGIASTSWFRHVLQHRIENDLSQLTGGKVEIEEMGFRPLDLRLSARHLVIHGLEKDTRRPLFSARNVVVNVSPETLIQFRLVLRSLAWQRADLRVRTYNNGSTNVPGTAVSPSRGKGVADLLDLGIERLSLNHTALYWHNQRIPLEITAGNLAIHIHVNQDRQYTGTVASRNAGIRWKSMTLPLSSFDTSFILSNHQLKIPSLSWQVKNLRGSLACSFRWTPDLAGEFEFRTSGGLEKFAQALKLGSIERGYLFLDGKGSYGSKGLSLAGRVRVRELLIATPQFKPGVVSLAADYRLAPDKKLEFVNATLAGLHGRAQGRAAVFFNRPTPRLSLSCRLEKVGLTALLHSIPRSKQAVGIFRPQATISGTVSATWQERGNLQSRFDLQMQPPVQQPSEGLPLGGQAQGTFDLNHNLLVTLSKAQINTPHSSIQMEGAVGDERSSLIVQFTTTDFEEWRPLAEILIETKSPPAITLHSPAVFNGTVSGTFSNPEIEGQMRAGRFNYGGWNWDSIRAGILASPQHVRIQSAQLKLGRSSLVLNAEAGLDHWKLEPTGPVRLQATAHQTPLAGLRAALNLKPSMQGLLTGQVEAKGTVESLSGHGKLSLQKGEFAGLPFDSLSANVAASKSAWRVSDIELAEGSGRAKGDMEINPQLRTFSANLRGKNFPLDQIRLLKPKKPGKKGHQQLSGLVSFDLEGKGNFENARVSSKVDITQLAWQGQPLGSIQGHAEWQGQKIALQVSGGGGQEGTFQASGNIDTGGNWPLDLSGQFSSFRADPWIEEFSGHQLGAKISASGAFQIHGPILEKTQIVGSGNIQTLQIEFPELQLSNSAPVEVSYAKRTLTFARFRLQGEATNFEVGGSVHIGHPASLDLSASGRAAATLMSLIASDVQATGESELKVQLRGSLAEPQLSGEIQVKDVGLGYTNLPFRLNALNGTIKLEGERAVISSLKGTIGGGTVNIAGFVVLQEGLRYQIRTELSQVRVRYPSDFTSVLGGQLVLAGTSTQGQLSGNIAVRNIFANENLKLVDFISGSGNLLGLPSPGSPSSLASRISLNVRLASLRPVRIETHNLRLVSDINLHLQGTLSSPVVIGNVYLRSGQAVFRGNRYTLTRGDIAMTNPFQTEPVIDMQVNTQIDKYDLTLEVSGPLDQIRFSYRSDPPLPTEDILSLLAFGYSKRLQEFAPETKNPFSSAGASALLSQALSSQVSGRIQRLFGVSRIKLSPTTGEVGTLGGPVLTVEQQISSDLTLTYQTSTANSLYRVVEFNWTVNPRMSVRGFRDQNGIFGVELKFRKRFK